MSLPTPEEKKDVEPAYSMGGDGMESCCYTYLVPVQVKESLEALFYMLFRFSAPFLEICVVEPP